MRIMVCEMDLHKNPFKDTFHYIPIYCENFMILMHGYGYSNLGSTNFNNYFLQ